MITRLQVPQAKQSLACCASEHFDAKMGHLQANTTTRAALLHVYYESYFVQINAFSVRQG